MNIFVAKDVIYIDTTDTAWIDTEVSASARSTNSMRFENAKAIMPLQIHMLSYDDKLTKIIGAFRLIQHDLNKTHSFDIVRYREPNDNDMYNDMFLDIKISSAKFPTALAHIDNTVMNSVNRFEFKIDNRKTNSDTVLDILNYYVCLIVKGHYESDSRDATVAK